MENCPICNSSQVEKFIELASVPVHIGIQWPTREQALQCPKGDIELTFCGNCGFISNPLYDESLLEYGETYDNSLHFSPIYQEYAERVARRLVDTYGLSGKSIIEIGSGKGEFLTLLCTMGDNSGVGFDSSYEEDRTSIDSSLNIQFIRDYFSENYSHFQGDLICSRYVLEHVPDPLGFMSMIRKTIQPGRTPVIYFEVPNANLFLLEQSIWDIIYEHCSYFGMTSLAALFEKSGFEILQIGEHFSDQMVSVEARPKEDRLQPSLEKKSGLREMAQAVLDFEQTFHSILNSWEAKLSTIHSDGKEVVIWGAGAKGVSFLNMLPTRERINFAVDINPHKQGKFVPGSAQEIVSPGKLTSIRPDIVIVMNPVYTDEIRTELAAYGLNPDVISVDMVQNSSPEDIPATGAS